MKLDPHESKHLELLHPYLSECALFLKRNDAFPLDKPCSVAAYGNGIRHTVKGGTGSGEVNSRFFINVEKGLIKFGFKITSNDWLDKYYENLEKARKTWLKEAKNEAKQAHASPAVYCMGMIMPVPEFTHPLVLDSDAAIYVVSRICGEGNDRRIRKGDVLLTESEIKDILTLNKAYKKFMLVINTGGVIDLTPVLEVNNILLLSELGVETGLALAEILLGKANPTGKLTDTWAKLEDYPYSLNIERDDTVYSEGEYVGYRYFDSFNKTPLFPFGFGLSYSSFKIDNYVIQNHHSQIEVKADITNLSRISGKEVLQVYISKIKGTIYQELAGFSKSPLINANKTATVTVKFDMVDLAKYNESKEAYILEKGEYLIRVGNSSNNNLVVGKIILKDDVITKKVNNIFSDLVIEELTKELSLDKNIEKVNIIELDSKDFIIKKCDSSEIAIPEAVNQLTNEQLAVLNVGGFARGLESLIGNSSSLVPGGAGEIPSLYKDLFGLTLSMADGPAGLRICPKYVIDKKGEKVSAIKNKIVEDAAEFFPKPLKMFINKFIAAPRKVKKGEVIHYQYCTALPIGTAIAQSWNTDFARLCGDIVGKEMELFNVDIWLAPALNIHKNILCGRNFEYYSEDPLLSGLMAANITLGVQSHKNKCVTIKHYAANNQETNRLASNSIVSEKTLRDIYLKGFELCIKYAQPKAVMSSYNLINGIHSSENRKLINDFLYIENDFKGIVMTDWVLHMAANKKDKYPFPSSNNVALGGTSLMMPGSKKDINDILRELKKNEELKKQIKINITRVLNLNK